MWVATVGPMTMTMTSDGALSEVATTTAQTMAQLPGLNPSPSAADAAGSLTATTTTTATAVVLTAAPCPRLRTLRPSRSNPTPLPRPLQHPMPSPSTATVSPTLAVMMIAMVPMVPSQEAHQLPHFCRLGWRCMFSRTVNAALPR